MKEKNIAVSSKRLLLNAEAFGFGPTAAIASFFPFLKKHFAHIGYIGEGHTLNIQYKLPYDSIYDVSNMSDEDLEVIAKQYDVFFTAMDFQLAYRMKKFGLVVGVYDALVWYWKNSFVTNDIDIYIAQNFFGVQEKLDVISTSSEKHIVSPILPSLSEGTKKDYILVNFGGLHNPFRTNNDVVCYVEKMITSIIAVLPKDQEVIITTSYTIAKQLPQFPIRTLGREDMKQMIAGAKMSFMTSGLGNIYDVAHYNIPTVRMPPSNDSQGQQLMLLKDHNLLDGFLNREDFNAARTIDYNSLQNEIIDSINAHVHEVGIDSIISVLSKKYEQIIGVNNSKTVGLLKLFGVGGDKEVADILADYVQRKFI